MLILSQSDLSGLLPPSQVVDAVEAAARSCDAGLVQAPPRLHLSWNGNTLLAMPASAPGGVGTKVVTVVPRNASRDIPVTNGLMILNDTETGVPISLMNAAALTAQRTGAVGALGVKYLTPEDTSSAGIIGCGVQGAWQAIFACSLRPISELFVFDRSTRGLERFSACLKRHAPNVRLTVCQSVRKLLESTDLLIAATSSAEPVLPDEPSLLENKHFISVGSYRPTMQELPDSVYRLARLLAIDSEHARQEVGDVINPVRKGLLKESDVFSIADCVVQKRRIDTTATTAYKSVGSAMYDLFVAQALFKAAKEQGLGVEIDA